MPIDWNLSDVSLMVRLGLWVFRKMVTEVKCHSHHIASRVHPVNMTSITVDLDHLAEGVFVRFLHHELSLSFHPHFPYCPLWSPFLQPLPKEVGNLLHLLEDGVST